MALHMLLSVSTNMLLLLLLLQSHKMSWPFLEAVNPKEVPEYYRVIKEPMGGCLDHPFHYHPTTFCSSAKSFHKCETVYQLK